MQDGQHGTPAIQELKFQSMSSSYTEDHLVEQPAIQLMQDELGWDFVKCWDEWISGVSDLGRDATATFCWERGSIFKLRDSFLPCIWNP